VKFNFLIDAEAGLARALGHLEQALGVFVEAFVARENVLEIAELDEQHLVAVLVEESDGDLAPEVGLYLEATFVLLFLDQKFSCCPGHGRYLSVKVNCVSFGYLVWQISFKIIVDVLNKAEFSISRFLNYQFLNFLKVFSYYISNNKCVRAIKMLVIRSPNSHISDA
jgi:hypothetical protein